jgi:hypothetical protein
MLQLFLPNDRMMAFSSLSRYGMTFGLLTDDLGKELLTWFLGDSHARISVRLVEALESRENDPDSGEKWLGSLAKYDPDSRSWKTHQISLIEDLSESLETLPRWGTVQNMEFFPRLTPAGISNAKGSGSWPAPTASNAKHGWGFGKRTTGRYKQKILDRYDETGWTPWPSLNEALMDWPIGWTDLKPLGMAKFQQWLAWHGKF